MNDLIGLEYAWANAPSDGKGTTDCFQLCCEIRRRLGLYDYAPFFAWVYGHYAETALPRTAIARWLLTYGHRVDDPKNGDPVLFPAKSGRGALGTYLNEGVLFIGPRQNVIRIPFSTGNGHLFRMER